MTKKEMKALADEQAAEIEASIKANSLEDVLSPDQLKLYKDATPQQQIWLEYFVRTGNPNSAANKAYPNQTKPSRAVSSGRTQKHFGITLGDIFKANGLDELKIVKKTNVLLDAKRIVKTFKRGEETIEESFEDPGAIAKGLDITIKQGGHSTAQRVLLGEDKDNPMTSLAAGLAAIANGKTIEQPKEE